MKFFQRLLVAPAALGLMAPLAANADITAISKDSELNSEVIEARVDGVEAQLGELMAGQFSSTTNLTGKAAFQLGYVDTGNSATDDEVSLTYMYQLNMNHSFTGDDLLYTRIKAGNGTAHWAGTAGKSNGTYLSSGHSMADNVLDVDKIWYQFPVGDDFKVWVGPLVENYYMLASAPSIYRPVTKQFALGGNGTVYGSSTTTGFGAAWTQPVDDASSPRFAVSTAYSNKGGTSASSGLLDEDGQSSLLTKFEYGSSQWQVSAAVALKENGWSDSYFTTSKGKTRATTASETAIGLRAYWKPEETGAIPSIQLGFDTSDIEDNGNNAKEAQGWMVGLMWDDVAVEGNRVGVAFGSRVAATAMGGTGTSDAAEDNSVWEAYYSFKVNDGVTITPAIFGGDEVYAGTEDISGGVILTEFRF